MPVPKLQAGGDEVSARLSRAQTVDLSDYLELESVEAYAAMRRSDPLRVELNDLMAELVLTPTAEEIEQTGLGRLLRGWAKRAVRTHER